MIPLNLPGINAGTLAQGDVTLLQLSEIAGWVNDTRRW
jgi:hypothetical protein